MNHHPYRSSGAKSGIGCASLALYLFAAITSTAHAAQTCRGSIKNADISSDVVVESSCVIENASIQGAVTLQPGASLVLRNTTIFGSVSGDKVKSIDAQAAQLHKGIVITGGANHVKFVDSSVAGGAASFSGARSVELVNTVIGDALMLRDGSSSLKLVNSTVNKGLSCEGPVSYQAISSIVSGPLKC
ncbi:hypothetical protein [Diaphorobacter caeni]|uniref:hypothetical protein n=1 Tax=Diaphorobacter caeni TaxID=2784387 RepID=UPI00188DE17F|nr:hypothetical protein [Diaphorobacter caeni]MBF5004320.1 hypothetical protein [Diaphorobacter caeni]